MSKTLTASNVAAWFGSFKAIEDVNLTIAANQVTALIGPSGCGKSTFLRTLNRMHEVVPGARVSGDIRLDDVDIYDSQVSVTEVRRSIGMVFQKPNPFPTMSIKDNVVSGLRLTGIRDGKHLDEVAERSLQAVGLWEEVKHRLDRPGTGLSGGQQQRLCIARAIAIDPEVILMDEPCSALDPISTLRIEDLMTELKEKFTVVVVTHNMQQAARVSDTTAFFTVENQGEPGRLIEVGETSKIFTSPEHPRTEAYITGRFG
jgi:phosphate transport system ATP-binding protein